MKTQRKANRILKWIHSLDLIEDTRQSVKDKEYLEAACKIVTIILIFGFLTLTLIISIAALIKTLTKIESEWLLTYGLGGLGIISVLGFLIYLIFFKDLEKD